MIKKYVALSLFVGAIAVAGGAISISGGASGVTSPLNVAVANHDFVDAGSGLIGGCSMSGSGNLTCDGISKLAVVDAGVVIASTIVFGPGGSQAINNAGTAQFSAGITAGGNVQAGGALVSINSNSTAIQISGSGGRFVVGSRIVMYNSAPTLTGGCTTPTMTWNTGTATFQFDVGTSCTGVSTITVTLPTASNGWTCNCWSVSAAATRAVEQTGGSTTTCVLTNFVRTTGVAGDWADGADVQCVASAG